MGVCVCSWLSILAFALLVPVLALAQTGNQAQQECDLLAANPLDSSRPPGIPGVPFDKVDAARAEAACQRAIQERPSPRIYYELGRALVVGHKDEAAVVNYRIAADQGYVMAQNNLGVMYEDGKGVAKDYAQAVLWYRRAADQGYAPAQNNLGVMFENGWGVARDQTQAISWYRKAAEQGFATAQKNLASAEARNAARYTTPPSPSYAGGSGQAPLPTTREPSATAMGRGTFSCGDGSTVTVNLTQPPSISIREGSCSMTFIDGRNSTVFGKGCDLGLLLMPSVLVGGLMTMQQSVTVKGDNVSFYAHQTPSVGMMINKGTGIFRGSFNVRSGRIRADAITPASAIDEICRPL